MILNEFVAFVDLGKIKDTLDPRLFVIATFALCGFANLSSIAIQIGGIGGLAPSRKSDLARLGVKAMIVGTLANFMSACIAAFPQPLFRRVVEVTINQTANATTANATATTIRKTRLLFLSGLIMAVAITAKPSKATMVEHAKRYRHDSQAVPHYGQRLALSWEAA